MKQNFETKNFFTTANDYDIAKLIVVNYYTLLLN